MSDEYVSIDSLVDKAVKSQEAAEEVTEKAAKKAAKKEAKESRDRMTKVKKGIIGTALTISCVLAIGSAVGGYGIYNANEALKLRFSGDEASVSSISKKYGGDINPIFVIPLLEFSNEYKDSDVNDIGGILVTKDGTDYQNTMKGKIVTIEDQNGVTVKKRDFDMDYKVFKDLDDLEATVGYKELVSDYKLSLKEIEDHNFSYQFVKKDSH